MRQTCSGPRDLLAGEKREEFETRLLDDLALVIDAHNDDLRLLCEVVD